jgi:uncharacterized cupredoxin-like copper-binding protein
MKTTMLASLALAGALSFASAAEEKTFSEKAGETLNKAAQRTKEAGRAVADTTRKAAESVAEAVTPDADARKVEVTLTEHKINMPNSLSAGKTAFVVTNNGKDKHNFEIEGQGIDKKFMMSLGPNDTKTLHVDLKPGSYKILCPVGDHADEGMKVNLQVK